MDHDIRSVRRNHSSRTKMTAMLASLSLLVFWQLLVSGHPHVTENGTLVETTEPTTTGLPENIPEGYVVFPEDHAAYKIHREDVTWNEAREKCILEGARLAITDSIDKIKHITTLKEYWGLEWLHVGIRKSETTGQWVRIDTNLPLSSIPWRKGEPDGFGECVGISAYRDDLLTYGCNWEGEYFVCEIPM